MREMKFVIPIGDHIDPAAQELVNALMKRMSRSVRDHPELVLNDLIEVMVVMLGGLLASVPEEHRDGMYAAIGHMLDEQAKVQLAHGQVVPVIMANTQ
jgi:hypothetical protein